ncbi:MAG: IS110 family transposase [Rhodoferax sp.]|nr:IS110 family transposase [Rhodoferax sp.]MCB2027714.1 IS110 family transposase [Rhodoferax sp.]MCP5260728.1 IS110 family transposase [Rhodoferax sp.]
MTTFFAGLDWASQSHAVCVIDAQGGVCERLEVAHNATGLAELLRRLKHWRYPPVAIERPSGLVVDTLVEAGLTVIPIHPNAVKATRPRYRSHGAKSDASDAYLLADLLRTDGHRFKPLSPQSDEIRALRALVRGRDDLVATRVQLANQLRSLLESFWPGGAAVFADVDSPIALDFIERYPTPESAARLGPKRMAAFCAQHAYSGRRSPEELLERLHEAPASINGELETDAKGELVRCLVRTLQRLVEQIRLLSSRIEHHVASSDDGRILMSFPRAGRICAAQILAELGSVRERFGSDEQLAAEAGVAPVTYASGKSKAVAFRWACNHRLRAALTCQADNSRHDSVWAADVYAKARARGCDHPHAVRILSRAWVRVIWRAWVERKPYDPSQHRALQNLLKTAGG